MRLKVVTPTRTVLDAEATRILADGPEGAFGILPRHVDYATRLNAGILVFVGADGAERFLGVIEGTLVKCGPDVLVSTPRAIEGEDLGSLEERVAEAFAALDEEERVARTALARLEAGIVRRFIDLEKAAQ